VIPPLNESGQLPPGRHIATIEEVIERFGHGSEQRQAQAESLQWLLPLCRRAGIVKILINGSFTSDKSEPNDVDCVLLEGPGYRSISQQAAELRRGLPFLELKIVVAEDYDFLADTIFGSDRSMIQKGVVEVVL
jgi:hypothetical protein